MVYSRNSAIIVFGIIVFCAFSCHAAVYTQPAAKHPEYPGKCYDKLTKRSLIPGKEYKPKGICAVMTCDIEKSTIAVETCPFIEAPGCVEIPANPKISYPKCCPQYLCTDESGNTIILDALSF